MFNLRSASVNKCIATNCRQRPYVFATIFDERRAKTVFGDGEPLRLRILNQDERELIRARNT